MTDPHDPPQIEPTIQARRTIGGPEIEIGHSETLGHLFAAFARMQGKLPAKAEANAKGRAGTNENGRDYKYANIASVIEPTREHLAAEGLAIIGLPTSSQPGFATVTLLIGHGSGEWLSCTYHMPTGGKAQEHGSALTYCRRYMLTAMLNTSAQGDDDDGQAASNAQRPQHPNARREQREQRRQPVGYFDPDEQGRPAQQRPATAPAQRSLGDGTPASAARKAEGPPPEPDDPAYNDFHAKLTGAAPAAGDPSGDAKMAKDDWTQWQKRAIGQMGLTMSEVETAAGGKIMDWPKADVWRILDMIESAAKPDEIRKMGRNDRAGVFSLVREQLTGGPPE